MCIINFKLKDDPKYKLVIAANRDESYNRPTTPAKFHGDILHGTDEVRGGTWLGITKTGRVAMITNVRNLEEMSKNSPLSRGDIVLDFLKSDITPEDFLIHLRTESKEYGGFNVLLGDTDSLYYMNNYDNKIEKVSEHIHGLSNASLDTPWAKVQLGKHALNALTGNVQKDKEMLLSLLQSKEKTYDHNQHTGVGESMEYNLSSQFIELEEMEYGTRSSTVILITHDGDVHFIERTYNRGKFYFDTEFDFKIKQ